MSKYKDKAHKVKCTMCGIETAHYKLKIINGKIGWICTLHKES